MEKKKKKVAVDKCVAMLSNFLSGLALDFVATQVRLANRSAMGRFRWTAKDKATALFLYYASPQAYRLQPKLFVLPTVCTLRNLVKNGCLSWLFS